MLETPICLSIPSTQSQAAITDVISPSFGSLIFPCVSLSCYSAYGNHTSFVPAEGTMQLFMQQRMLWGWRTTSWLV